MLLFAVFELKKSKGDEDTLLLFDMIFVLILLLEFEARKISSNIKLLLLFLFCYFH